MNTSALAVPRWRLAKSIAFADGARRWWLVVAFAIAMAWVESAVVYYLRTMIDRIEPYQPNPLPIVGGLGPVELVREAATLVMLLSVGILAGRTWRRGLAYAAVAFGVWDIFYYVFLKAMCGWPHSLLDWDILFLLPLPWWGPVLAPVCIALLMIVWGTVVTEGLEPEPARGAALGVWLLSCVGMAVALYTFMAESLRVYDHGIEGLRNALPQRFDWGLFCLALLLMSTPVIHIAARRCGFSPPATQSYRPDASR